MSESRSLGQKWTKPELIVILDMYFNGHLTDSHDHDEITKCLGRYNRNTRSFHDGAVNQKLAEIKGYVEGTREPRHPGGSIIALIDEYQDDLGALRTAAIRSWRDVLRDYSGPVPQYVHDLLALEGQ